MTETVPVPIELLKALFDHTTITRDVFAGASVEVSNSALGVLIDIKSLLPSPPKVGDTLTAEQIADLPDASVMHDDDDDVLVKVGHTVRRITMDLWYWDGVTRWATDDTNDFDRLVSEYTVTLVSLPRD